MKTVFCVVLVVMLMAVTVSGDTSSVMVVRNNPTGQGSPVFAEPLMTYKQAERLIKQNEEIIKLLKDIERNTKKK